MCEKEVNEIIDKYEKLGLFKKETYTRQEVKEMIQKLTKTMVEEIVKQLSKQR